MLGIYKTKVNIHQLCSLCQFGFLSSRWCSQNIENKYSELEKQKVLKVINSSDVTKLSRFDVTKGRSKNITQWIKSYGPLKNICEIETIEGFSENHIHKLFDSIIHDKMKTPTKSLKHVKGHILHPPLIESKRQASNTILTVYITVNSVSWVLINKLGYEVEDWQYHIIDYPEKRFQLGDILEIAHTITNRLPTADLYVMKAEATSLRASGSDPNNPKTLGVNLQKAQLVSMIVALISTKNQNPIQDITESDRQFEQNIYFLRSSLPFRLYGTLIGNERVASDQTVEMLLQHVRSSPDNTHVSIPEVQKAYFRSQRDLPKDMMAQCLLFALTFMDLCMYKNDDKIEKLLSKKSN